MDRQGHRERPEDALTDAEEVADLFEEGIITSGGAGPRNASLEGLRALPGISNCPIIALF